MSASSVVHFGGPGFPPGRLRDLLEERIEAVPRGGAIDWVTYYFRDRRLAGALVRAHRRGVDVRVSVDSHPRTLEANDTIASWLGDADGLGSGFRSIEHRPVRIPGRASQRPHLHEKLYCFSHPAPTAFVGSFNPSGDGPTDDPVILEAIRDQDRGYNLLVELRDPILTDALTAHARELHRSRHSWHERISFRAHRVIRTHDTEIYFWPRILPNPLLSRLRRLSRGTTVKIAASHLKGATMRLALRRLATRGAEVTMITEDTRRRVPDGALASLAEAGITIRRADLPDGLPMHDKFVLVEGVGEPLVAFGSFNWTERSFRLNHELAVFCRERTLWNQFRNRWEVLARSVSGTGS